MKQSLEGLLIFIISSVIVLFVFQNCSRFQTLDSNNNNLLNTSSDIDSSATDDTNQNNQNPAPTPTPEPAPTPVPPPPMPSQNTSWSNKPSHLNTLNDTPHSAITQNGWHSVYGIDSIINDSSDPVSAPGVLQQKFPAGLIGGNGGGGGSFISMSKDNTVRYKEFFHGFWMKVDSQWEQHPVFTKISWLHTGLGNAIQGNQLFTGLVGSQGGPYSVNANYQNSDIDNGHFGGGTIGTVRFDPSPSSYVIVPGKWAKVEIYWKQSSCNTCRDGIYKVWVDGINAINVTSLNTDRIAVDSVSYITIWGGTGSVKTRDSYYWVAHSFLAGL